MADVAIVLGYILLIIFSGAMLWVFGGLMMAIWSYVKILGWRLQVFHWALFVAGAVAGWLLIDASLLNLVLFAVVVMSATSTMLIWSMAARENRRITEERQTEVAEQN